MPASSYRFVSPGVFIKEIDQSQLTAVSAQTGPTIIGRFQKGPTMRPVYINSVSQLSEVFGEPVAGAVATDVWRNGNDIGPTYAAYAAQAWLRNTPALNVIRLVGKHHTTPTNDVKSKAGWDLGSSTYGTTDVSAGAYGLFLIPSASSETTLVTGTLAAVFYATQASVYLSGALAGTSTQVTGTNALVKSVGAYGEFTLVVNDGTSSYKTNFNLNKDSDKYIRRTLNTNPILTNSDVISVSSVEKYWLGESYERSVDEIFSTNGFSTWSTTSNVYGFIAPLKSNTQPISLDKYRSQSRSAKTGWVIAQDLSTDTSSFSPAAQQKLFRIAALDSGEFEQKNYKISISEISPPATDFDDYGTFRIEVRSVGDTDNRVEVLEQYSVNLNPASDNYIARVIGDSYVEWSDTDKVLKQYGTYTNRSSRIRVEMDSELDSGLLDPTYLPFGFYGPPRFKRFQISSSVNGVPTTSLPVSPVSCSAARAYDSSKFIASSASITASIVFPSIPLRVNAYDGGLTNVTDAYFGISVGERVATTTFDNTYYDLTRAVTSDIGSNYDWHDQAYGEPSFIFTLDDVSGSDGVNDGHIYVSGSRTSGTSITAVEGGYRTILEDGYNKFTMPLYNGFDGFDVTEIEPLRNSFMDANSTERNNYVYYTYERAINTVSDPETLVTDIISIPGLTNTSLTTKLINVCENRADALAIVDLPNVYIPEGEEYKANKANRYVGTAKTVANDLKARSLNSSYGATYYPWVQINGNLWVPPSVVALGAISYGQSTQELWFAPAGFTRGGLANGRAGLAVTNVSQQLTSKDRDTLYESNINPIARFPAEGIVIFGQKTLQVTPSALDRINVRRMLIFVKREISKIAATLLFDQNVDATWARFTGQVNPFLSSIKSRLGLTDYRVILDNTTTTPDLIDRNVLYAKVFLKPARAIEFIAIDFTITDSGASFVD